MKGIVSFQGLYRKNTNSHFIWINKNNEPLFHQPICETFYIYISFHLNSIIIYYHFAYDLKIEF